MVSISAPSHSKACFLLGDKGLSPQTGENLGSNPGHDGLPLTDYDLLILVLAQNKDRHHNEVEH